MSRWLMQVAAILVLGIALAGATGCRSKNPAKRPLSFDSTYSVNVIRVPTFWPREKFDWSKNPQEREAQIQAWQEHGTPDYLRLVFTFDDRIIRREEILEGRVLAQRRPAPVWQWIYIEDRKVLSFRGPRVEESVLPDDVRTVCLYGDPNDIARYARDGYEQMSFIYHNHGLEFVFIDRRLEQEKRHHSPIWGATQIR